jgi:hypothetical protein
MTEKQKRERDKMRKQGVLPSPKKRLNRRQYAKMIIDRYKEQDFSDPDFYTALSEAAIYMVPQSIIITSASTEQIGVMKYLHIAMELCKAKKKSGEPFDYNKFYAETVKPIWNL